MWTVLIGTPGEDSVRQISCSQSTSDIFVAGYTTGNLNKEQNAGGYDAFVTRLSGSDGIVLLDAPLAQPRTSKLTASLRMVTLAAFT